MCGRVYGKIRCRGSQVVELVVTPTHAVSYYSLFLILLCQRNFQELGKYYSLFQWIANEWSYSLFQNYVFDGSTKRSRDIILFHEFTIWTRYFFFQRITQMLWKWKLDKRFPQTKLQFYEDMSQKFSYVHGIPPMIYWHQGI